MTQKRRSFTAAQKADAVRKYLKDRVPVSQVADEMNVQPTMIHNWVNTALAQVQHAFESPRAARAEANSHDKQVQQLRKKLEAKNEVIAELMEEMASNNRKSRTSTGMSMSRTSTSAGRFST